jgi:hypothetical protein
MTRRLAIPLLFLIAGGAGSAQAKLPDASVLRLLPKDSECLAQVDVDAVRAWRWRTRVEEAMPKGIQGLRKLGVYPLDGLSGITGATKRPNKRRSEGVFILEGAPRAGAVAIDKGRFVVGERHWVGEVGRNGEPSASLLEAAARPSVASIRGACVASSFFKSTMKKELPEVESAERVLFEMRLGEGLDMNGSIVLANEGAAAALLERLKARIAKLRDGRIAGIVQARAFIEPLVLERNGGRIDFRYTMKAPLIEQTLGFLNVMRNLSESSGDPLR